MFRAWCRNPHRSTCRCSFPQYGPFRTHDDAGGGNRHRFRRLERRAQRAQPTYSALPRKGQILSLAMAPGAFRRMIRWGHSYLVPRPTGELIVGATNEDAGFDSSVTPAGLGRLLMDAQAISSYLGSYPIVETWTGLRPATPDEVPILGS